LETPKAVRKPNFSPVMLKVTDLYELPYNSNVQDPVTFNNLVDEIKRDGFDEPLVVVPRSLHDTNDKLSGYYVVSGNHRLKAGRVLNFEEMPCIIKHSWDREKSKIKSIRRNNIKGENDPAKFTRLVESLETNYDPAQLSDVLGFKDIDALMEVYQQEQQEEEERQQDTLADTGSKPNLVDALSLILNRIFAEFGDTVPYSFLYFVYGTKAHLVVQANTALKKTLETITRRCIDDALDINTVFTGLLELGIANSQFREGPPDREAIEEAANLDSCIEYELKPVKGS